MITVRDISKKYNGQIVLENTSYDLHEGDIIGFLGANGAGKSTTMKIITGIIPADSGNVSIFGHDVIEDPIEAKKRIGYLSENNPLPDEMYVKEYLEYTAKIYKLKNTTEIIDRSILEFGLTNEYKKKIGTLSKGNRQKLGLAQAMLHNPDFLVLDEPTSALDPNQQEEILNIILNLNKSKIILLSTHILHDIKNIASRIIILDKGKKMIDERIENIESVENLFHNVTHENSSR